MTVKSAAVETSAERELVLSRAFHASRALLFTLWTDPAHVAQWWGPDGFTSPRCELDARPGGAIRIDMQGPDGTVYPMTGVFQEIVAPQRLVFTSAALDEQAEPLFEVLNTVTFAERAGMTTLRVSARVVKTTDQAATYLDGMQEGWTQTLDRLAAHVAQRGSFIISRVFDAPREVVWKAWTEPAAMAQWWRPKGYSPAAGTMDLRPGGRYHYSLRDPEGREMWGKLTYREIVKPQRLVFVTSFSDAAGGLARHPLSPTWPLQMLTTITFAEEAGRARLTVQWTPERATEDELRTFEAGRGTMRQGWTGTLDYLADYLAKAAQ